MIYIITFSLSLKIKKCVFDSKIVGESKDIENIWEMAPAYG